MGIFHHHYMISAFRKIRHRLLDESRFTRYVAYAFGEIILVVIGILIALSISNWNQRRSERTQEGIYVQNLARDMRAQLKALEIQQGFEEKYRDAAMPMLKHYYANDEILMDSIFWDRITTLSERKTFVPSTPTYTDLLSSGRISLISDIALKDSLLLYYGELDRVATIIQNNNTEITDQHYNSIALSLGYFTRRAVTWHAKEEIQMNIENQFGFMRNERLMKISEDILSRPENELLLINSIHQRMDLALGHIAMMKSLQEKTNILLEMLEGNE